MTFVVGGGDGGADFFRELDRRPDPGAFAGFHHCPPIVRRIFFEQQNFKGAAGRCVQTPKPGGNDAGVVQHEHITGTEVIGHVAKSSVFQLFAAAVQDEQARLVALRSGKLGNQLGG